MRTHARLRVVVATCGPLAWFLTAPPFADAQTPKAKATAEAEPEPSPARFDADLGLKGWNIPFPSFGDTLTQDVGGFRTALARYGVGFLAFSIPLIAFNMLDEPRETAGAQAYFGQQFSWFFGTQAFLMLDLEHYGVPGGQLQISGQGTISSFDPFLPDTLSLNRLAYYQSLFQKKLEVVLGYTTLNTSFVGAFIGGNIANPFGPSATVPVELGMAAPPAVAPAAWVKLNLGPVYNQFAVQRSLPPTLTPFISNDELNPTGFDFTIKDAHALLVGEIGYKQQAEPNKPYLWARLGGMYNNSRYMDFSGPPGATTSNFGAYLLVDGQIMQFDSSSPQTAFRGLHLGGSVMYGSPKASVISQYYEARAYVNGPFRSRDKDQISLIYFHQVFSHHLRDATNAMSSATGLFAQSFSNTITASYTGSLLPGLYATPAISYTDHPSFFVDQAGGRALLFIANLFIAF